MQKLALFLAFVLAVIPLPNPNIFNNVQLTALAAQEPDKEIKTFNGTIIKSGDSFALDDTTNKMVYQLDDVEEARQFEGRKVTIKGTLDSAKKLIRVQMIAEAA